MSPPEVTVASPNLGPQPTPRKPRASRPPGITILVLTTALVTALLLAVTDVWAHGTTMHGLSPIFFYLFTVGDSAGLQCALAIVAAAALISRLTARRIALPLVPQALPNTQPPSNADHARRNSRTLPHSQAMPETLALPRTAAVQTTAFLQWLGRHPLGIAAASAALLSWGAWSVYRHWPLSMDEYAAVFQSQVFAAGHITGQFPPQLLDWLIPRGFQDYFLNVTPSTGAVSSGYWPSFALLLTPFTWLGIPWVCNPLISAATLLATHRLALHIFGDQESAGLAVLLTLASPVYFADGISYYSMSAHLLANTLYALLLVAPAANVYSTANIYSTGGVLSSPIAPSAAGIPPAASVRSPAGDGPNSTMTPAALGPSARQAFLAGVIGSIALTLHNPVPHILFALPWIIWLLCRPRGARVTLSLFAGYLPLCLLLGLGWFLYTSPSGNAVAKLTAPFALPNTTVVLMRLVGIAKLWAWAVPGLLLLAAAGAWKWRHDSACLLLASSALLTLLGYFFVPVDQGHGWGYRYFHSAWIALPILATAALQRAPPDRAAGRHPATIFEDDATRRFIVACAMLSLVAGTALRAAQIHHFIAKHQSQVPAYAGTEKRVVILNTQPMFYGRDLIQNDPWLRDNVITLITHAGEADAAMMRANFPDMHTVYADRFGTVWSAAPTPVKP